MARTKKGTINEMGLEKFLNLHYGQDAYAKFLALLPYNDNYIAKQFSTPERELQYQTVAYWRRKWTEQNNG